jgi:hypothetical protein
MHFSEPPGIGKAPGTGIPPIRYQRTLLVYLLTVTSGRSAGFPS